MVSSVFAWMNKVFKPKNNCIEVTASRVQMKMIPDIFIMCKQNQVSIIFFGIGARNTRDINSLRAKLPWSQVVETPNISSNFKFCFFKVRFGMQVKFYNPSNFCKAV